MTVHRTPSASIESLPQLEDLPRTAGGGYDERSVGEAFAAFRRSALQMYAELRVLKAATKPSPVPADSHQGRMSAMRIIRAAAEFADAIEREAQRTASEQLARLDANLERRQRDVVDAERRVTERERDLERKGEEIVQRARREADEYFVKARLEAEQLSANIQTEVDETFAWVREHAAAILTRAQEVARQVLGSAAVGPARTSELTDSVTRSAHADTIASSGPPPSLIAPLYESLEAARRNAIEPGDE
jgi:cell division septum initiation protein DivIVA